MQGKYIVTVLKTPVASEKMLDDVKYMRNKPRVRACRVWFNTLFDAFKMAVKFNAKSDPVVEYIRDPDKFEAAIKKRKQKRREAREGQQGC